MKKGVIVLLTISCLYACDPCKNLDCLVSDYYLRFYIKNLSGTDLIFGPNSIYNKDQFRFYSLQLPDTTFYDYTITVYTADSLLQAHFFPAADTVYMQLSNGDIDTLTLTYQSKNTRCCGVITNISSFRYNNRVEMPVGNTPVHFIK